MLKNFRDALDDQLNESFLVDIIKWALYFAGAIWLICKVYGGGDLFSIDAPGLESLLKKYHMRNLNSKRVKKIVEKHGVNIADFKKEIRNPSFTRAMNKLLMAAQKLSKKDTPQNKDAVINAKKEVEEAINSFEPKQRALFRELVAEFEPNRPHSFSK
jgi:hypothetical protein